MTFPISEYLRVFDSGVHGIKNVKTRYPDVYQCYLDVAKTYKDANSTLQPWIEKLPKDKQDYRYKYRFKIISDTERQALQKKSSLHRTIAKVLLVVGVVLMLGSLIVPYAMLPVLLSLSLTATKLVTFGSVGAGALGTALALSTIWVSNTEAIRMHRAKTDPDFQFFVDRVVQRRIYIAEANILDKELHKAFLAWKQSVDELFSKEKTTIENVYNRTYA